MGLSQWRRVLRLSCNWLQHVYMRKTDPCYNEFDATSVQKRHRLREKYRFISSNTILQFLLLKFITGSTVLVHRAYTDRHRHADCCLYFIV